MLFIESSQETGQVQFSIGDTLLTKTVSPLIGCKTADPQVPYNMHRCIIQPHYPAYLHLGKPENGKPLVAYEAVCACGFTIQGGGNPCNFIPVPVGTRLNEYCEPIQETP